MATTVQEMVKKKKNSSRSGKSQGIYFESGKIKVFERSQEKVKLIFKSTYLFFSLCFHCFLTFYIFLYIFIFMHMNIIQFGRILFVKLNKKLMMGFPSCTSC